MSKIVTTMSSFIAIMLFTTNALPGEYPTGIASIKLGDSKRTVYEKVINCDQIESPSAGYQNWLANVDEDGYCEESNNDRIELFGKEFKIEYKFSKRDKLFLILMRTFVSREIYPKSEKCKVSEFSKLVVEQYSLKYGKPAELNLDAYPVIFHGIFDDVVSWVATWQFPNNVSTIMTAELNLRRFVRDTLKFVEENKRIYFVIAVRDEEETKKIVADRKKKEREERTQKFKKSRDLL